MGAQVNRSARDTGDFAPRQIGARPVLRLLARVGDRLCRVCGGRLQRPLSFQEYATSAVEVTLDISKAKRELGYLPIVGWEEGLEELKARAPRSHAPA